MAGYQKALKVSEYARKQRGTRDAQSDPARPGWPMPGDASGAKKKAVRKLKGMKKKVKTTGTAYESKPKKG